MERYVMTEMAKGVTPEGKRVVSTHDGGTFGFDTEMFMLPWQGVGIVILTNVAGRGGALNDAINRKIIAELFEGAKRRINAPAHRTLTLMDDQMKYFFTRAGGK
jgi:hypothetical protein